MLEPNQQFDLLKTLYLENNKELVFWRERNWNTVKLVVSADVALAGLALFKSAPLALISLVVALAVIASLYLYKNFHRYQEKRSIGARIETALGLFEKGAFMQESVLPDNLAEPKADKRGSYSFIAAVLVVAVAASFAIAYARQPVPEAAPAKAAARP
ncbi:MAG: hypothetical protein F9K47_14880 [Burkholderiales bacterium]|nr:MAG: hypothetical protein F9K47_14880 [Burkholderiales bacterium]